MRRPAHAENTLAAHPAWRASARELVIRSTFIVGFPGETEAEFEELLNWIDEAQLDRVGCFKYSPVDGATANALPDHVPPECRKSATRASWSARRAISAKRALSAASARACACWWMRSKNDTAIARSEADAPEIDGVVRIAKARQAARRRLGGRRDYRRGCLRPRGQDPARPVTTIAAELRRLKARVASARN